MLGVESYFSHTHTYANLKCTVDTFSSAFVRIICAYILRISLKMKMSARSVESWAAFLHSLGVPLCIMS